MKKLIVCAAICLVLFAACQNGEKSFEYRSDINADDISQSIAADLPDNAKLTQYSDDDIEFYLGVSEELFDDSTVMAQTSSVSIDEFGVFLAKDETSANELETQLKSYISSSLEGKREYLEGYNPGQVKKLEEAEVKRYGSYVVYMIMDKADRRIADENIRKILLK